MNFIPRYTVKLVKDGDFKSEIEIIEKSNDVFELMYPMMEDLTTEHFYIIMLDRKNKVIGVSLVYMGTIDQVILSPRDIFQRALLTNSCSIILVHNHPSGDPTESFPDINTTKTLAEAGKIMSIPVVDHIIIGNGYYVSLQAKGHL